MLVGWLLIYFCLERTMIVIKLLKHNSFAVKKCHVQKVKGINYILLLILNDVKVSQ